MRLRGIDEIATVMRRTFAAQKAQARGGKVGFADWDKPLADKLAKALGELYLWAARSAAAKKELGPSLASLARQRAVEIARAINETTSEWIRSGRELKSIFGDARIAQIAVTEAVEAKESSRSAVAKASGKRLQWVTARRPTTCDFCKKLDGKVRTPGKMFGSHNGVAIYHPPVHPSCFCRLESVQ